MPRRVLVVLALLVLGLIGVGVTTAVKRNADTSAANLEEPDFELPSEDPTESPTPLSTDNPADIERSESPTPQVTGPVATFDPSASPDATATTAPASPDAQPTPSPEPTPEPSTAPPAASPTATVTVPTTPAAPSTPETGAPVALAVGGLALAGGAVAVRRLTRG